MSEEVKQLIEADAIKAVKAGLSIYDACPYTFRSPEGIHWLAIYALNWIDK